MLHRRSVLLQLRPELFKLSGDETADECWPATDENLLTWPDLGQWLLSVELLYSQTPIYFGSSKISML